MQPRTKRNIQGVLAVMGAFLLHLTYGHFYTIANMAPYIMGYSKMFTDKGLEDKKSIWLSALALGIQGFAVPTGGFIARRFGYRLVLVIGCLMESGGIMLTYFTIQQSFLATVLTYALMNGAGFSVGYSVSLAVAAAWFPERKGLVMGIVVGGFGLGSVIFTPIQTAFINPNNTKVDNVTRQFTDKALLERVPSVFLLLGTVLLSIQVIALFMIRKEKPKHKQLLQEQAQLDSKAETQSGAAAGTSSNPNPDQTTERNLTPKQVLRNLNFYLLWLLMFCSIVPITLITSSYKYFGQMFISDDQFLSVVATTSALFNFAGRIMWGGILDRVSYKLPLGVMYTTWAVLLLTFPHLKWTSGGLAKALFMIWVFLIFICLSGVFAMLPVVASSLFGPVNLAINYGMAYTAFGIGGLLSAIANSYLAGNRDYVNQYSASAIVCLCATFTVLWLNDEKMPQKYNCCKMCTRQCAKARRFGDEEAEP